LVGKKYCEWRKLHGDAIPHGLVDEDCELEAWCLIEDADKPFEIPGNGKCFRCKKIEEHWVMV
jgi:hypothetical protein